MKISRITLLAVLAFAAYFFAGCKKGKKDLFTSEYQNIMRQNALSQAITDDALKIVENIMMNNNNAKTAAPGAPLSCITDIDTVDNGPNSKIYTIVFPESCTSYDGKYRSGTMTVNLEGTSYNATGATITIHFNDYYINSNKFEGKITCSNLGNGLFKVIVSDEAGTGPSTLSLSTGPVSYWKTTQKRGIYMGNGDAIIINNKYHISAYDSTIPAVEGVSSDNKYYTGTINTELLLDYSCPASGNLRYPLSGVIQFNSGSDVRTVNYGDSTACDYGVSMSANNESTTFDLY